MRRAPSLGGIVELHMHVVLLVGVAKGLAALYMLKFENIIP